MVLVRYRADHHFDHSARFLNRDKSGILFEALLCEVVRTAYRTHCVEFLAKVEKVESSLKVKLCLKKKCFSAFGFCFKGLKARPEFTFNHLEPLLVLTDKRVERFAKTLHIHLVEFVGPYLCECGICLVGL